MFAPVVTVPLAAVGSVLVEMSLTPTAVPAVHERPVLVQTL